MGIFASRPEEPFEWAGLPSEPLEPKAEAELLGPPPVDVLGIGAAAPTSVPVPLPPASPSGVTQGEADESRD